MKALDLTGKRFGRLVAMRRIGTKAGHALWLCQCDCGNETKSTASNLTQGLSSSCGCVAVEKTIARCATHGQTRTPEYRAWRNMITRCENCAVEKYPSYGGAGITVCKEWRESFESFYRDMGPRPSNKHSVDRIDGVLGYCRSNCRWATAAEQAGNRSTSIQVVHAGERKCLKAACETLGLDYRKSLYSFRSAGELPDGVYLYETVGKAILRYQAEVNRRACEAGAHEFTLHWLEDMWQTAKEVGFFFKRYELPEDPAERAAFLSADPEISLIPRLRIIACNTIVFNSQFFDGFYDPENHDIMAAFATQKDGRIRVSLYSTKPEIDCGAICKTFGGGGHRGAAGFICDKLPWETP